jgi:hypothetical protein
LFEEKGELPEQTKEKANMSEEIFNLILTSEDGNYTIQAQILAAMKPIGW